MTYKNANITYCVLIMPWAWCYLKVALSHIFPTLQTLDTKHIFTFDL